MRQDAGRPALPGTDRLDIGRRHSFLEGQHGMERDRPVAGVGDGVRQQQGLDFRLGEGTGMDLLKQADETP